MPFDLDAWNRNQKLFREICIMPFNEELAIGILCQKRFKYYLIQDSYYLVTFARALAIAAAKANHSKEIIQLSEASRNAISEETKLHKYFFKKFGIESRHFSENPISPTCHHYSHYLISTAFSSPYPIILAALLPCFKLYAEIGSYIYKKTKKNNPYILWIETYSGEKFNSSVQSITTSINQIANDSEKSTIEAMHKTYTLSTKLEWMFWKSAYNFEVWTI